ncbi:Triosephosphate isomerase [Photobacterium damselae subsp. piscicida]|uniref:Triosephosphate isomerase n=1 Tax=Photobacterium damsela subsp. piscicida TaxID=38294 RepID=L7NJL3_PHODP|nr:triose-phosphate isomerase [Photobacterium damselae]AEU09902.1 triosephosphate isomerase [Photobacterium damselae subsp. piscicida]MBE8128122.1 triose-phosphate isomerase [Photobacterium damselae subsp. piscicida]MDP2515814.1 triose-phosphate isomerase [Photobacterium damselae subsp. piscicida]MDP2533560.1 triose-phosphate isomerase [Photobacterium damselae subsp. piscicida]MDP2545846.1 triose-phosphate isomerase [Photobacterium damselae subsp. piscicida]
MHHPVVMGNWKLNGSKEMVSNLIKGLDAELNGVEGVDVAIAPPVMFLDLAEQLISKANNKIILGAQNVDIHESGAFTGDISPAMLKEFGATHIIIGHSERRDYHNESDEFVAQKFAFLKEHGLTPVLCIGESEAQNEAGETVAVCARQIDAVIKTQGVDALNGAIIAYEPIWAIGTGKAATAEDAQRIHAAIRAHIAEQSEEVAKNVVIQYGGSVKPENAAAYFAQPDIDGALVGGAALDAASFAAIAKAAAEAKK